MGKYKHSFLYNYFFTWQSNKIWLFINKITSLMKYYTYLTVLKDSLQAIPRPLNWKWISSDWSAKKRGFTCLSQSQTWSSVVFTCNGSVSHCLECRQRKSKGHNLLLQTLKQHDPNQSEPGQPACSWSVQMPRSESSAWLWYWRNTKLWGAQPFWHCTHIQQK